MLALELSAPGWKIPGLSPMPDYLASGMHVVDLTVS